MSLLTSTRAIVAATVARYARVPDASLRLARVSVILGFVSLDLDGLTLFSVMVPPSHWFSELLITYGPITVLPIGMLALGGPLALIGLRCAGATLPRGRVPYTALVGVALCSISLAAPVLFAATVFLYMRGLL